MDTIYDTQVREILQDLMIEPDKQMEKDELSIFLQFGDLEYV